MAQDNSGFDDAKIRGGFVWGLLIGAVVAFLRGPRFNVSSRVADTREMLNEAGSNLRDTLETVAPKDPLEERIAEGKAAARRRQSALKLNPSSDDD